MTPILIDDGRLWDLLWDRLAGRLRGRLVTRLGGRIWDVYGNTVTHDSDID
jgi:hypothetical protein